MQPEGLNQDSSHCGIRFQAVFAEVVRPLESAVDSCYTILKGCYTDLPRNYSRLKLHIHTYIYIYIHTYVHLQRKAFLD